MDSVGQRLMVELHSGRFNPHGVRDGLEVSPNLWAGVALVRGGAGTALVGGPEQVAGRSEECAVLGIEHFILYGYRASRRGASLRRARLSAAGGAGAKLV